MLTLAVMAAGLGSRYQGLKQIDSLGPQGETLMDYSIGYALNCGFDNIVIILSGACLPYYESSLKQRWERAARLKFVVQDAGRLPAPFTTPESRVKPWGTGHALLTLEHMVHEPFVIINADDYYGKSAFSKMADFLLRQESRGPSGGMAGYQLKKTTSSFGSVSRGICTEGSSLTLKSIREFRDIVHRNDEISQTEPSGQVIRLKGDEKVSMNFWGFYPDIFPLVRDEFREFLRQHTDSLSQEFLIPEAVNNLIGANKLSVRIIPTRDKWFGITYPGDREGVVQKLKPLASPVPVRPTVI